MKKHKESKGRGGGDGPTNYDEQGIETLMSVFVTQGLERDHASKKKKFFVRYLLLHLLLRTSNNRCRRERRASAGRLTRVLPSLRDSAQILLCRGNHKQPSRKRRASSFPSCTTSRKDSGRTRQRVRNKTPSCVRRGGSTSEGKATATAKKLSPNCRASDAWAQPRLHVPDRRTKGAPCKRRKTSNSTTLSRFHNKDSYASL